MTSDPWGLTGWEGGMLHFGQLGSFKTATSSFHPHFIRTLRTASTPRDLSSEMPPAASRNKSAAAGASKAGGHSNPIATQTGNVCRFVTLQDHELITFSLSRRCKVQDQVQGVESEDCRGGSGQFQSRLSFYGMCGLLTEVSS